MKKRLLLPTVGVGITLTLLTAGCSDRPEVEAALGPAPSGTEYPELLSTDAIVALDTDASEDELAANAALAARASALRARASGL